MTSLLDRPTGAPLDVRPAPTAAAVAAAAAQSAPDAKRYAKMRAM